MTNLNTNLTLETIQKSKVLQEIECEKYHKIPNHRCRNGAIATIETFVVKSKWYDFYSALTIADVISNAESLFGKEEVVMRSVFNGVKLNSAYAPIKYQYISEKILSMCFNNKPLKEIEEYVIKNLK